MHNAFDVATVFDWRQLPFHIEALDTYGLIFLFCYSHPAGSRVLVSTTKGLLVYNVTWAPNELKYSIDLLETKKSFSKKPPSQLYVVEELKLLISLCDNCIQVNDLESLTLRKVIEKSKGCTAFSADLQVVGQPAVDSHRLSSARNRPWQELTLRLAVVMKRKIVTFTWNGSDFIEQKVFFFSPALLFTAINLSIATMSATPLIFPSLAVYVC